VNNKSDKYNGDYWSLQDRNEVRDETMLRYSETRDRMIALLLEDAELNRLHHAALARAEGRLEELRQTEAYHTLKADLARASEVPISQIVAKPPQPRDREKIAALMSDVEKARAKKSKDDRKAAGPKEPVAAVPMGSYLAGKIDLSAPRNVEVYANHSMKLPADDRVFAAPVLPSLQAGKFERGLARKMPQVLPKGAKVLEIGSAVGFLAGHCANTRPDISVVLQEDNAGLVQMMQVVCTLSKRDFNDRFRRSEKSISDDVASQLGALIVEESPDVLWVGDGRVQRAALVQGINQMAAKPVQVYVYGRWLEAFHAEADALQADLAAFGYAPAFDFDPNICRAFALQLSK
jgi:hypothetical protein